MKILEKADVFIVTVPTPIDNFNKPDLSLIKKACKEEKAIKIEIVLILQF